MNTTDGKARLVLPFLQGFYTGFAEPLAFTVLRLAVGLGLVYEGWPKIQAPFAQAGFVESLGFYPGNFWSAALAVIQFFGGFMIAAGLLTRPVALANAGMLLITLWFHASHPYGDAFLTADGLALLKSAPQNFTPQGLANLGNPGFLAMIQDKALFDSLYWSLAAGIFAAFGGGAWSIDRLLGKEF